MSLTILIIFVALLFDFINGFHDAANSIATIVATKVLKPLHAVLWAAFFNFAALFVFDTGVAATVGNGLVDLKNVTPPVVLAGLLGAIIWNLSTWWLKLPSSSSHALIGGYAGAAVAHRALSDGHVGDALSVIIFSGWNKMLLFMLLAPLIGWLLGAGFMGMIRAVEKRTTHAAKEKLYGHLQLLSSAFLSLTHGGNDAQKTAGVITGALVASGYLAEFHPPYWAVASCYLVMGLGTMAGGWRIVHTLGYRLTRLDRQGGFCAESAAAFSILLATLLKLPISTTQATTGAVIGIGSAQRQKIQWRLVHRILAAWLLTLPAAGALGAAIMLCLRMFF